MSQNTEAQAFIERIVQLSPGPGISLHEALQPSLDDEAELRKLWATDKTNARLSNPYVGLVDVFNAPGDIRTTSARVVKDEEDLNAKYVMPLSKANRRKEGTLSMVADLEEFQKNWAIFTENSLSQLIDWNNVVAAGGSVLACLTPLSNAVKGSKRAIRKYYHSEAYPTSDVDLFLWGMTPEQAEVKINAIYKAVRDSVPWDVTCVRTKHTVSIHSQYPNRSVQIVLRLYSSPAEILAGFDIDAPCCAYDGTRVWANPRAIVAMMRQCNTVDMTRRSPSYEVRLAKYSRRGFEVYVPTLRRGAIDPTIYERSIARMQGLARLLVFEKLADTSTRSAFLQSRRELRGRPAASTRYRRYHKRYYRGDLKGASAIGGLEMNDYDVASLHIPYGPGWDARRIEKLIFQTDFGINCTFNPKNEDRRLHRHPAFFGTMKECLEDCCENCAEPIDDDERKLQSEEDKQYVRGRFKFIEENPGRQSISGSFNPIDIGEWSEQVYVKPTEAIFTAIAAKNLDLVKYILALGVLNVNQRDYLGRTSLHVAIISRASDIACELIDAGVRVSARLVDGRTPLHLAAQYDLVDVVIKLLKRNAINAELAKKDHRDSTNENEDEGGGDDDDKDDLLEVNAEDHDFGFSALSYAILYASFPVLEVLITNGADVKMNKYKLRCLRPLTLTIFRDNEDEACKIAERLLRAGASSSVVDKHMCTILHMAVNARKVKLASHLLKCDPSANSVVNLPALKGNDVIFPLASALSFGSYSAVAILLAHGAKVNFEEGDITKAREAAIYGYPFSRDDSDVSYVERANMPVETAMRSFDDIIQLLLALGAQASVGLKQSMSTDDRRDRKSLLDWVDFAIISCTASLEELETDIIDMIEVNDIPATGWNGIRANCEQVLKGPYSSNGTDIEEEAAEKRLREREERIQQLNESMAYLVETKRLLLARGAKTWSEIYPDREGPITSYGIPVPCGNSFRASGHNFLTTPYYRQAAPHHITSIHPETILNVNLLQSVIHDRDLEAFVQLVNLYHALPEAVEHLDTLVQLVLNADLPEFLDEYIRHTGYGIDSKVAQKKSGNEFPIIHDENGKYLGLNIHGKKRAGRARQGKLDTIERIQNTVPLVWKAAYCGAKEIIKYLASDKPLAAFHFYSTSNSKSECAERLRRTSNLDEVLPGWTISVLGESPLTAAIMGNRFAVIKVLFSKKGSLTSSALRQSIKYIGYNPLLLAVQCGCDIELIDDLLEKWVSPAERDQVKGWNIYHFASHGNNGDLVEHFLRKLPQDLNEALLVQQSKNRLNTPLHLAVKAGSKRVVQLILNFTKSSLLTRNVDGYVPLHHAVIQSYPEILQLLIDAGGSASGLNMEDGIGQTPYEIHSLQELKQRLRKLYVTCETRPSDINPSQFEVPKRYDTAKLRVELPLLRSTIDALLVDGKLNDKPKLTWELITFATMMETRLQTALDAENAASQTRKPVEPRVDRNAVERGDIKKLRKVLLGGLAAATGPSRDRQLVHLIDVQRSVRANLEKVNQAKVHTAVNVVERQHGMIFKHLGYFVLSPDNE